MIREAEISWGSSWMARPRGPKLWGLCSLGGGVGHVHLCGVVPWADMEDYKGHVGALARCHILHCKVARMGAAEHHRVAR